MRVDNMVIEEKGSESNLSETLTSVSESDKTETTTEAPPLFKQSIFNHPFTHIHKNQSAFAPRV